MFEGLTAFMVKLFLLSVFVTSIIEVVKGISAIGLKGLIVGLWRTLWGNQSMQSEAFPVLSFVIALYVCWAFNVTAMSYVFQGVITATGSTAAQLWNARWVDYFGTASVIYMGSDQLFKRLIDAKKTADEFLKEAKEPDEKTVS